MSIEGPTADPKAVSVFTAVRKVDGAAFPPDLPTLIQQRKKPVELCHNEGSLLSFFLAKLQSLDPDVLVGHGLHSFPMEVLLSRLAECNTPLSARIGRLQRRNVYVGLISPLLQNPLVLMVSESLHHVLRCCALSYSVCNASRV